VTAFPLRPSRDGGYLEARITGVAFPAAMTAKIKLKTDKPEYRFDFTFPAVTREPVAVPVRSGAARARATPAPRANAPAAQPSETTSVGTATAPPLPPTIDIPGTIPEILAQLKARDAEIRDLIRDGNFAAVWVPAFQAKDLAIGLEPHIGHLTPAAREAAEPALQRVVRFAWLLDSFGDLGNRQQVQDGYAAFTQAVMDVSRVFGVTP
jgi:hypothetical protein